MAQVCLFGALSLPVVVGALLVEFGYVRSTQSQIILLFTNNLLDVLRMLITIGLSLYEGHKLKLEFEKSISAVEVAASCHCARTRLHLRIPCSWAQQTREVHAGAKVRLLIAAIVQAARVVAAGGVAAMAVHISQSTTRASGDSHVAVQTMPPQLLALDEELKMLKASNQSLDPIGPGQKGAVIFMVTALVLSCAVPRLWNKASYILILRSVLLPALALRIARRFTRAPYPRENIVQRICFMGLCRGRELAKGDPLEKQLAALVCHSSNVPVLLVGGCRYDARHKSSLGMAVSRATSEQFFV
eukprot:5381124-Pleurochrysis_carterae.AAC.3